MAKQETLEFKGKVALVTGASRGIGRAIAIELPKNGASIAINYHSDIKSAKETQKLVNKTGVKSEIFKADVSKQKDIKNLIMMTPFAWKFRPEHWQTLEEKGAQSVTLSFYITEFSKAD